MDKLMMCAVAFSKLLNINYHCVIGRKGKTREFVLAFDKYHFHHLAGLHKISDKKEIRGNRERVFNNILSGNITYDAISASNDFVLIESRLNYLHKLELFLDSNSIIFKYDSRNNPASGITALYLLQNEICGEEIYLFIDKDNYGNALCGKSFFLRGRNDYAKGQTNYTLLYKEKVNTATNDKVVQYDKLTSKEENASG